MGSDGESCVLHYGETIGNSSECYKNRMNIIWVYFLTCIGIVHGTL